MSAVEAAVAVADAYGVHCEKPVVLREAWHVLVHLWPSPVVGRVTSGAPGVDPADVELAVARHAARAGAPVVPTKRPASAWPTPPRRSYARLPRPMTSSCSANSPRGSFPKGKRCTGMSTSSTASKLLRGRSGTTWSIAGLIPTMSPPGWERFEGFLWKTTSLLVLARGQSLVVDPAISESEVARIGRRALELDAPVRHVLITHGDWDHVCGVGGFPDAVVVMGQETAEKVESGAADRSVRRAAEAYGFAFSGPPRVDQTFSRGSALALGPFVVETFPLLGHTADGSGFRLREPGILLVGDYLSAVEFPFATSPAAYRMTLAGLIAMLRDDPPETVIPGHGPPLEPEDALTVAEADLRYLRSLHAAVVDALAPDGTRDEARAAGLAVDLPRECPPDLEPMRGFNVDRQIAEILPAP